MKDESLYTWETEKVARILFIAEREFFRLNGLLQPWEDQPEWCDLISSGRNLYRLQALRVQLLTKLLHDNKRVLVRVSRRINDLIVWLAYIGMPIKAITQKERSERAVIEYTAWYSKYGQDFSSSTSWFANLEERFRGEIPQDVS